MNIGGLFFFMVKFVHVRLTSGLEVFDNLEWQELAHRLSEGEYWRVIFLYGKICPCPLNERTSERKRSLYVGPHDRR